MDHFAHVPEAGHLLGGGQALFRGGEGQLGGPAAAVQTGHIQTPALFFLDQAGAMAQRAVLQVDIMIEFHGSVSFF